MNHNTDPDPTTDAVPFLRDAAKVTLAEGAAHMFEVAADELVLLRQVVADLEVELAGRTRIVGIVWRRK